MEKNWTTGGSFKDAAFIHVPSIARPADDISFNMTEQSFISMGERDHFEIFNRWFPGMKMKTVKL